jgi:hypothetical protein
MNEETLETGFNRYIGDGVYASFDGHQIWLAANDHRNKVVALEPSVMMNLDSYRYDLHQALKERDEKAKASE